MRALFLSTLVSSMFVWVGCPGEDVPDAGAECTRGCDGDELVRCDEGEETRTDCSEASATCAAVGDVHGCQVAIGEACLVDVGDEVLLMLCDGDGAGCVGDGFDAVCTANVGACEENVEGTCDGDVFTSECFGGQKYTIDCATFSEVCDETAGDNLGGCVSNTAGLYCDDVEFFCGTGLTCNTTDFECE